MRMLIGIGLILVGGWVLVRGLSYSAKRTVFKVGEMEAAVKETREVPSWVGGIAIVGGLVVLGTGRRRGA